MPFDNLKFL